LGECYHQTERLDAAEEAYQKALKREPNSPDILNNLAALYIQRENFEGARDMLQPLVLAHPERNNLRLNFAIALANTGSLVQARSQAQEVLKHEPNNATALELIRVLNAPE